MGVVFKETVTENCGLLLVGRLPKRSACNVQMSSKYTAGRARTVVNGTGVNRAFMLGLHSLQGSSVELYCLDGQ